MDGPRQETATSAVLGLLIAIAVFLGAFYAILHASMDEDPAASANAFGLQATATRLADQLLSEPGEGWYSTTACSGGVLNRGAMDPDLVKRFGLGEDSCVTGARGAHQRLNYDKLAALHHARVLRDPANDALDYQEARRSLGLEETGLDFHLRSWPVVQDLSTRAALTLRDPNMRPLYIGDYEERHGSGSTNYLVQHVAGYVDLGTAIALDVRITNNGTTTTAFTVSYSIPSATSIAVERHTPALAPGATHEVTLLLSKTAGWTWKDANPRVDYVIRDPSKTVGEGSVSLAGVTMTFPLTVPILLLESTQLEYRRQSGTAWAELVYDAVDGAGRDVSHSGWSIVLRGPLGLVVATDTALRDVGGSSRFPVSSTGAYRAELLNALGTLVQATYFNVVDDNLDRFTTGLPGSWVPTDAVPVESAYLDLLARPFSRAVPDVVFAHVDIPFLPDGDVWPDDNRFLGERLPDALRDATGAGTIATYNVVVVGSGADHKTLTSANVKYPLMDFVVAGGTLIVLGSDEQAVQWLEPLFHAGLETANGGIGIPDPDHAVLRTPNDLDVAAYEPSGTAWRFHRADERQLFTHVVQQGSDDILAVSDPGVFGEGRVVLTSWRPYAPVAGPTPASCRPATLVPECPGLQIIDNFVTLSYRILYLDYGPPIPANSLVAVDNAIAIVYAPTFSRSIEVRVFIYVFGTPTRL